MIEANDNVRLLQTVAVANEFCAAIEQAAQFEKDEFVDGMLRYLPQLYLDFSTLDVVSADEEPYFPSHVEETYYDSVRRAMEMLFGPDDMYLETFEEDMKYSDTPIAVSLSEGLADIFQDLYDFVTNVRESDGDALAEAFVACRENFRAYWSQTLCNVMRPLNHLHFHPGGE